MRHFRMHLSLLGLCGVLALTACKKNEPAPPAEPAAPPAVESEAPAAEPEAPAAPAEYQPRVEVAVTEKGFEPATIRAKAGEPLTLVITRTEERTCATEILFEGQEGKTELPLGKTVEVVYTPQKSGQIKFGCAMGKMIGGVLEVE